MNSYSFLFVAFIACLAGCGPWPSVGLFIHGVLMIHLHLTREAFKKVKDGLKKSEFRPDNHYYNNHVWKVFHKELKADSIGVFGKIYCGYYKVGGRYSFISHLT